jgi:hypothetical protein
MRTAPLSRFVGLFPLGDLQDRIRLALGYRPTTMQQQILPLVVDLDGTLIASDLLIESFFALLASHPWRALAAFGSLLMHGSAAFKAKIAAAVLL